MWINSILVSKVVGMAAKEMDIIGTENATIRQQIADDFKVGDGENATATEYIMHFFSMPWKVLLALIPPPRYLGGWLCFIISLAAIGYDNTYSHFGSTSSLQINVVFCQDSDSYNR